MDHTDPTFQWRGAVTDFERVFALEADKTAITKAIQELEKQKAIEAAPFTPVGKS